MTDPQKNYEITEAKHRLGGKKPASNTPRPPSPKGSGGEETGSVHKKNK